MGLVYEGRCKICKRVRKDEKLLKRIYGSKHYIKGGEPLLKIAREEGMTYGALHKHCNDHQTIDSAILQEEKMKQAAKREEKKIVRRMVRTADVRGEMIDRLSSEFEGRELSELSDKDLAGLLLRAAKDADDVAAKKKDQDLDVFRMMSGWRSGDNVVDADVVEYEPFDPFAANG